MQAQDSSHPTGVDTVEDGDRGGSALTRARDRKANAALQLKFSGASWEDIAETLGFPTARMARVAVERALEKEMQTPESREMMRNMVARRYERVTRAFFARAIDEEHPDQFAAADRVRQFTAEYVKLMGLNAPVEYVVNNPTQAQLEQWVARVAAGGSAPVEEGDIFDIEVVEDEEETLALPAE